MLKNYFKENNIPLQTIIICATDGAASMVGSYRGFKNAVPENFLHTRRDQPQNFVEKNGGRLHDDLAIVIEAVNHVKSNTLENRLFRQICEENK
jgi:hypothetical protein